MCGKKREDDGRCGALIRAEHAVVLDSIAASRADCGWNLCTRP